MQADVHVIVCGLDFWHTALYSVIRAPGRVSVLKLERCPATTARSQ
jgi:hypothetical protein